MLNLLATLYGKVRAAWPVNRVVTLLAPILFAPAAGYVAAWVPQHLPGIAFQPSRAQLAGLFALGATRALVIAYKWLDGWQKHEQHVAWTQAAVDQEPPPPPAPLVHVTTTGNVAAQVPPPPAPTPAQAAPAAPAPA